MKELIVIVGTILLGCLIFNMIAGDNNSLKSAGKEVMKDSVSVYLTE